MEEFDILESLNRSVLPVFRFRSATPRPRMRRCAFAVSRIGLSLLGRHARRGRRAGHRCVSFEEGSEAWLGGREALELPIVRRVIGLGPQSRML